MSATTQIPTLVGIVAKHKHPDAHRLLQLLCSWLQERSIPFCVDTETATHYAPLTSTRSVPRSELGARCSHLVIMGGDGTLISVCRHAGEGRPVIVGVNLGTLGFLTEITVDEMLPVLEASLAGTHPVDERHLIEAVLYRAGEPPFAYRMLNDVVISKQALARIFSVQVEVNSAEATLIRGDGVIVASPAGSTAYSLAAGGAIVHPSVRALLITPICPHTLSSRPLVIPEDSKITLRIDGDIRDVPVYLTIDGQEGRPLISGDRIEITTSPRTVRFAKSPSKSYYEILGTKLKWAGH